MMKKIISLLLSSMLIASTFSNIYAEERADGNVSETVFYVAPYGDDNNTGSEKYPFKSLEGAKNKVRSLLNQSHKGDITVIFKEGEYRIDKTVSMNASDSGNENGEITYKAEEKKRFSDNFFVFTFCLH